MDSQALQAILDILGTQPANKPVTNKDLFNLLTQAKHKIYEDNQKRAEEAIKKARPQGEIRGRAAAPLNDEDE